MNDKAEKCESIDRSEVIKIHFRYWVGILTAAIILIATDRWTGLSNFTAYLTNAATLTSLFLGVIAIIYSFVSNDGLSKSIGSIAVISNEVKQTRDQIVEFLHLTKNANDEAATTRESFEKSTTKIGTSLDMLDHKIQSINSATEALQGAMTTIPTKLDTLELSVKDAAKKIASGSIPETKGILTPIPQPNIKQFINTASISANLLTYACVLANTKRKPLSIMYFCGAIDSDGIEFWAGYLSSMNAIGIVEREIIQSDSRKYTIKSVHPDLGDIRTYIIDYANRVYADDQEKKDALLAKVGKLESTMDL